MHIFKDQMNRSVRLSGAPKRIISLVPSQTELLYDLGLADQLIGITKFCIHPHHFFKATEKIGGTKKLRMDKIRALKPDLIIGNKEENEQSQIEELAKEFPVWMSDILNLEQALEMIQLLGTLCRREQAAQELVMELETQFGLLENKRTSAPPRSTAYFIWRNPWMAAGSQTFIDDMLQKAGFLNVFSHTPRYPVIDEVQLKQANPSLIFLSSEPYPFKDQHIEEFREICPDAVIKLVDGELFSWYGSRLRHAVQYFLKLQEEIQR